MTSHLFHIFVSLYLSAAFQTAPPPTCEQSGGCAAPPNIVWINPAYTGYGLEHNHIIYHELGHTFDFKYMTPAARRAFELVIGDYRLWDAVPNSPHEKFAEAVARCFDGTYNAPVEHVYEYEPTRDQWRRICRLIEAVYDGTPRVL